MLTQAIIPARGGSKGVPGKNVIPLAGKPLIAWTIEAAKHATSIDDVFVSTDDSEIADVAEKFGAKVIWRPTAISGDLASSEDALLHAIEDNEKCANAELIAFLQCTSPLTDSTDIDGTVQALIRKQADTAVAVSDFHYFLWRNDAKGFVGINHDKSVRELRQQREPNYLETGSVYVMSRDGFQKNRHRFFGKIAHYEIPSERVLEVDDPVDFRVAEVLLRDRNQQNKRNSLPKKIDLCVFDFDGVLTNDHVLTSQDGIESVVCCRSDGLGIELARKAGLPMLILSSEKNIVVAKRAEKLKIEVLHGVSSKEEVLGALIEERKISWSNVVYVGNDINDLGCLQRSGCGVVVADAHESVRSSANMILSCDGGNNAVRELIDLILPTI